MVRISNINYGMLNQILNPPNGFEDVIKLHFALKKDAIAKTIEEWEALALKEKNAVYDGLVLSHNSWASSLKPEGAYSSKLSDLKPKLLTALSTLPI